MSSDFRQTRREDAPAIAAFLQSVFSMAPDNPVVDRQNMEWKYWLEHPDWQGSRGYVIERGNEIIAHGAVVPLQCLCGDQRLKIVHLIDWAARPDSTGTGISLLTRVRKMTDGIFAAGGSTMTEKILPTLGFKESCKAIPFVRPLRPLNILLNDRDKSFKSVARFGRRVLWGMKGSGTRSRVLTSRQVHARELQHTNFPLPRPTEMASSVFDRSREMLAWFLQCPSASAELYVVESGGQAVGYFVLTLPLGQARIADAWMDSDRVEDWVDLYSAAVEQCKQKRQIAEVATIATTEIASLALRSVNFHARGEIALRFLVRGAPPPDIRYQLLDGEGAYLHDGRADFWS